MERFGNWRLGELEDPWKPLMKFGRSTRRRIRVEEIGNIALASDEMPISISDLMSFRVAKWFQVHRLLHRHLPRFLRVSLAQLRRIWNLIIILYLYRFLQIVSSFFLLSSCHSQSVSAFSATSSTKVESFPVTHLRNTNSTQKLLSPEAMEEEKGEENDGERTEKEHVTPISERPVRERKRTERYSFDTPPRSSGNKPVSIEQGGGTRLKEIPNVAYKLSKRKPDDNLFLLHTILYGKKGKAQMLKKNIGQFSGFVWSEQEEEKQRARAKEKLEKCIKEKLIDFCDVLDIPINKSNVKKEELAVRVLEFLVYPKATRDIVLADSEKKTKKRKKSTPKNITSAEASDVPAKRRRQVKKSGKKQDQPTETEEENGEADVDSEGTNDSHGEDDVAPEKENNKNKDTETEDKKDKAEEKKSTDKKSSSKRTKKEKPAPEEEKSLKGSAKSGPKKSSKEVDKSTLSSSKKQKVEKDDSSKEKGKKQTSKPQAKGSKDQGKARKKGKTEPTRKQMHVVVVKILKEVDFNTATLSDILKKLGNHFGVDLMHRKAEVKDIITDAINEMSDDDEREENTEDEGVKEKEDEEGKD